MDESALTRAVIEQWRRSGPVLAAQRRAELRAMSDEQAFEAVLAVLDLAVLAPPLREEPCGLVEQQRIFARARSPRT